MRAAVLAGMLLLAPCTGLAGESAAQAESRQVLVDKVAADFDSPYLLRIVYDGDYSEFLKEESSHIRENFRHEEFWRAEYSHIMPEEVVKKVPFEEFSRQVLQDKDARATLEELIYENDIKRVKKALEEAAAITIWNAGLKDKSEIFVSGGAFEGLMWFTEYGKVSYGTEDVIKEVVRHELYHAEQNAKGLPTMDGRRITPDERMRMDPTLNDLLDELCAHIRTFEYFREKGEDAPELASIQRLLAYFDMVAPEIKGLAGTLGDRDRMRMDWELGEYEDAEASMHTEYGRIAKKLAKPE